MSIVVMILLVGKRGLFWIVYNNYSMKALLNSFELYLSIIRASKNNNRQTCHRKWLKSQNEMRDHAKYIKRLKELYKMNYQVTKNNKIK